MTPQQIAFALDKAQEFERLSHGHYAPVYEAGKHCARYVRALSDEVLRLRRERSDLLAEFGPKECESPATPREG